MQLGRDFRVGIDDYQKLYHLSSSMKHDSLLIQGTSIVIKYYNKSIHNIIYQTDLFNTVIILQLQTQLIIQTINKTLTA